MSRLGEFLDSHDANPVRGLGATARFIGYAAWYVVLAVVGILVLLFIYMFMEPRDHAGNQYLRGAYDSIPYEDTAPKERDVHQSDEARPAWADPNFDIDAWMCAESERMRTCKFCGISHVGFRRGHGSTWSEDGRLFGHYYAPYQCENERAGRIDWLNRPVYESRPQGAR